MANEQRNREEKGGQERQGQDPSRQGDKGGQHRDEDKSRRNPNERDRSSTQKGRKP
jgi:hypothetical protein